MHRATIETRSFAIECPPEGRVWTELAARIRKARLTSGELVRLILVDATNGKLIFEGSFLQSDRRPVWPSLLEFEPVPNRAGRDPFVVVSIIPTGIRAEIGGFAGDATPSVNLLASACDWLITNPNSVTASDIYNAIDNIFYLEGNLITRLMLGHLELDLKGPDKLGVLIENPREERFMNNVLNAVNAMRATGGITVDPVVVSEKSLSARCTFSPFGHASADFSSMEDLVRGLEVIESRGAGAAAISSTLLLDDHVRQQYYSRENIPNPWGGAEAILTHTATTLFRMTAAHAPLLAELSHSMFGTLVDPRDAAELISTSYIGSVIKGLARSPRPVKPGTPVSNTCRRVAAADVSAVVMPANSVGNIVFFTALEQNVPIVLVRGNHTIANTDPEALKIPAGTGRIYYVDSYLEAAGLLLAMRRGISLESLRRPLEALEPIYLGKANNAEREVDIQAGNYLRS
ncbi:MAG: DUF3326 domain-containing protein [Candidatus Glassbacteria bacterium]